MTDEYYVVSPEANAASAIIADFHKKLGKPTTPFSKSGEKMMDIIIAVWRDLMPKQSTKWIDARKSYQEAEMTIQEQVRKKTGRTIGSYPMLVYRLMKKVFPKFDPAERKNMIKMVKRWPIFRFANVV